MCWPEYRSATGGATVTNVHNATALHQFAADWLAAWNSRDLDRILSHYADGVDYRSPFVATLSGDPSGRLFGKPAVRAYIVAALARFPDLRFVTRHVYAGADSVAIEYDSVNGL